MYYYYKLYLRVQLYIIYTTTTCSMQNYCTAVLGIKQTFTYATVCLLVRSCCLTCTQRYQSKSLDEISL
jgi:hypothetical protein